MVGDFLHPFNPEPFPGEALSRAVNHWLGGIETVPVDTGRASRFEKDPGPASDIEKPAVASAVPKVRVNGRSEDVIFFDGVFFESSLKSIFFAS